MKDLTFAKVMIALCVVGSMVLAWIDWNQYKEIQRLRTSLQHGKDNEVERLVRQTQKRGKEYAQLDKILSGDELGQGDNKERSYISNIADRRLIDIGQVKITATERNDRNTIDKIFTITPNDPKRVFTRMSIANFLFSLEDNSRRVRVTRFNIDQLNNEDPPRPRPEVEEFPSDRYQFTAVVTTRERVDGGE